MSTRFARFSPVFIKTSCIPTAFTKLHISFIHQNRNFSRSSLLGSCLALYVWGGKGARIVKEQRNISFSSVQLYNLTVLEACTRQCFECNTNSTVTLTLAHRYVALCCAVPPGFIDRNYVLLDFIFIVFARKEDFILLFCNVVTLSAL